MVELSSLDICDLVRTEESLRSASSSTDGTIRVVSYEGRLFILDGHHRTCEALVAGKQKIWAEVIHIEIEDVEF